MTLSMRVLGGWLIGAILLIGCNADDDHRPVSGNEVVKFNSWLSEVSSVSRASDIEDSMTKEEWKAGDYIGVYMKENGKSLSDNVIIGNVDNNKYMSTKDGKNSIFIAASEKDEIYYPYNSPTVSFVAYYPYKNTLTTDYLYPIDISNQKEDLTNVDLLYATFENKSSEGMNIPLTFHHQLTKLVLNLQPNLAEDKNAYFEGIKVRANGFYTKANFSLVNKLISDLEKIDTIPVKTSSDGKRVEVILIPQTAGPDAYIEFDLFGDIVKWHISANKVFEAGKQYEYTLYLGKPWIEVDEEKISSWGDEISVPVNWNDPTHFPINLVKILGGDHLVGSPKNTIEAAANEYPQHKVSVGTFWISPYEITIGQYVKFLNDQPGREIAEELQPHKTMINYEGGVWHVVDSSRNNYPVTNVTWYGARAFAQWLGGDLPSEAEWETACRAGNYDLFSFSGLDNNNESIYYARFVNCRDEASSNGEDDVLLVNALSPNKNGLFNMHGNASEWCRDAAVRNANGSPAPYDYKFSGEGDLYVIRGGSYKTPLNECRSASRTCLSPEKTDNDIGFRVVFPISNVPNLDFGKIERVLSLN
ncbi:Serine/threonine-protein kinase pkn1 [termite gut metagenome]|uniref:Serine/threonine-protein kinase pkn1 n=1 Tax=termite gut metagenome TaxID=433724 RepID=A0A5J4QTL6_9ZZZZ